MKIKEIVDILPDAKLYGEANSEISGIAGHSSKVKPGFLYIAKRGAKFDGNQFIPEAIANGASCIMHDKVDPALALPQIVCATVPHARLRLQRLFSTHPPKSCIL